MKDSKLTISAEEAIEILFLDTPFWEQYQIMLTVIAEHFADEMNSAVKMVGSYEVTDKELKSVCVNRKDESTYLPNYGLITEMVDSARCTGKFVLPKRYDFSSVKPKIHQALLDYVKGTVEARTQIQD